MPVNHGPSRRFTVTIAPSGGSAGPADETWAACSGGAVEFPALPVISGDAKAVTLPFASATLQVLVLRRFVASGPDASGSALRDHLGAILSGAYPSSLDIVVHESAPQGRRLVYRRAYLRRWQLAPLDRAGKDGCDEWFEFLASDLEITR